jgi:hypothetical protein
VEQLPIGSVKGRAIAAEEMCSLTGCNVAIKAAVVMVGTIPQLAELLSGGSDKGRAYAAGALGNLGSNANKAAVATAGALPLLVKLLS